MGTSIDRLVNDLEVDDASTQGSALARLIVRGKPAVPALEHVLHTGEARQRALAAEGLSTIADPSSAEALAAALDDADGHVRSLAAAGLAHMGDPRGIPALVRTLNDDPDIQHADLSRSAYELARLGTEAVPAVTPLLTDAREATRWKAMWIVQQIFASDPAARDLVESFDPMASLAERDRLAARWQQWLKARS